MKIMKAYKFRLYPNIDQKILINKTIGCTRFIYNYILEKKIKNNKLSRFDLNNLIPRVCEEYPYLKEVDSMSLRCAIKDLSEGFNKYYSGKGGIPNFKKKGIKNSYRTNLITSIYKGKKYENIKLDLQKRIIILPKLKEIKIRGYRHRNYTCYHDFSNLYKFTYIDDIIRLFEECFNIELDNKRLNKQDIKKLLNC